MIYPGHMGDSRTGSVVLMSRAPATVLIESCTIAIPKPSEIGLPYEQLTLETSDKIKIKAFLILQGGYDDRSNVKRYSRASFRVGEAPFQLGLHDSLIVLSL
jgi:hypothetical protein